MAAKKSTGAISKTTVAPGTTVRRSVPVPTGSRAQPAGKVVGTPPGKILGPVMPKTPPPAPRPAPAPAPRPPAAPRPAPTPAPAPIPRAPVGGGGGGGGGGGTGLVANAFGTMAAPAPMPSVEDYLPTDSIYTTEAGAIDTDLKAAIAALARERSNYDLEFGQSMRNLGWMFEDPNNWGADPSRGQWASQDNTTAFGSGMNNLQNDYAGRGLLRSSFYGRALEDFLSGFDRQRNSMFDTRQGQMTDWATQEQTANDQARQARDKAREAAIARRAAQFGL